MPHIRSIGAVLGAAIFLSACGAAAPVASTEEPSEAPSLVPPSAGNTPLPTIEPSPSQTTVDASLPPLRQVAATTITLSGTPPTDAGVVAGPDAIWVKGDIRIYRIDPTTNQVTAEIPISTAGIGIAVTEGAIWIADFDRSQVLRLDPDTGDQIAAIPVGTNPEGIVAAFGSIWTADHRGATVTRIDPATNGVSATIRKVGFVGGGGPQGIAAGSDRIWVGVGNARMVYGIDPTTDSIVAAFPVGRLALPCGGILDDGAAIWVGSCYEKRAITRFDPDDGSSTIIQLPAFAGQPVRIGELIWFSITSGVSDPLLLALRPEDETAADAISLPAGSAPDFAVNAFGSLWIMGPTGTVLRLALSDLGG